MGLVIKNVRVIDPSNQIDEVTNVYVKSGRFLKLDATPPKKNCTDKVIDATGKWLIPGLIDMQGRLAEPGNYYSGSITTETKAAVSGGITAICCPPDTVPVADNQAVIELIKRRAKNSARSFVYPIGAMTRGLKGEMLANMLSLKQEGCIAVSQANNPIQNPLVLRNALNYASSFNILVILRCEDKQLRNKGVAHAGDVSSRLGLAENPSSAETIDLARNIILVEETGVRVHFSQISTAESVEMIAAAKQKGLPISCDVAIHQLHLNEYDTMSFNSLYHVSPPLRSQRDMNALISGVESGVIDAVVSDHTPLHPDDKQLPFSQSKPGISGFETLLPLMLKLVERGHFSLSTAIASITANPARILQVDRGSLTPENLADFCLVNPEKHWILETKNILSSGKNNPFQGWDFNGIIEATYIKGHKCSL